MSAEILRLPVAQPACSKCVQVAFTRDGLRCTLFNEPVAEPDAQDCMGYEPDD